MSGDVVARAREFLSEVHDARCPNCSHELFGPDDYRELMVELVGYVEKLRRGGKALGRMIELQNRDVLNITGLHHLIGPDGDGDWGAVWERLAEMAAAGAEVEKLRGAMDNHQATIFQIQEARVDYNAALNRREHGAVAADHFMRNVFSALDIHAAVIERAGIEP